MRSRMSSKFGKIQPWSGELTALERLKKSPLTYNGKDVVNALDSAIISDWIFFIFAGNKDSNKSSDEFEIQQDSTIDWGVTCPLTAELAALECFKNQYFVLWPL